MVFTFQQSVSGFHINPHAWFLFLLWHLSPTFSLRVEEACVEFSLILFLQKQTCEVSSAKRESDWPKSLK